MNAFRNSIFRRLCKLPGGFWLAFLAAFGIVLFSAVTGSSLVSFLITVISVLATSSALVVRRITAVETDAERPAPASRIYLTPGHETRYGTAQLHIVTVGTRRNVSRKVFWPILLNALRVADECGIDRLLMSSPLLGRKAKLDERIKDINKELSHAGSPWRVAEYGAQPCGWQSASYRLFARFSKFKVTALSCDDSGRLLWGRILLCRGLQ